MRIGVLSDGEDLTSYVSDDFGHAPFFLVIDSETMDYTVVKNEFTDAVGAGMKVAEAIVGLKVDAVITGGIGPHGYDTLTAAGIKVSFDEDGTVEECVQQFLKRIERQR